MLQKYHSHLQSEAHTKLSFSSWLLNSPLLALTKQALLKCRLRLLLGSVQSATMGLGLLYNCLDIWLKIGRTSEASLARALKYRVASVPNPSNDDRMISPWKYLAYRRERGSP